MMGLNELFVVVITWYHGHFPFKAPIVVVPMLWTVEVQSNFFLDYSFRSEAVDECISPYKCARKYVLFPGFALMSSRFLLTSYVFFVLLLIFLYTLFR